MFRRPIIPLIAMTLLVTTGCGNWPPIVNTKRDIELLPASQRSIRAEVVLAKGRTHVSPAAGRVLPSQQTDAEGLNDRRVHGVAQPVEEKNRQGDGIGGVLVVHVRPRFAQILGRFLDGRVGRRDFTFQKRQASQGGPTCMMRGPTSVGGLEPAQALDAAVNGALNLFLVGSIRWRPRKEDRHKKNCTGPDVVLHDAVFPRVKGMEMRHTPWTSDTMSIYIAGDAKAMPSKTNC